MRTMKLLREHYAGRRVLVTGSTGFKGSWLSLWLEKLGAKVLGVALAPNSPLSVFSSCKVGSTTENLELDVRRYADLASALDRFKPETVFHLAGQAIVGIAHEDPRGTFETNLMGTVNVLDWARTTSSPPRAMVMITSDKCYDNVEQLWGYREIDRLGGEEAYSASKACAELAISSFRASHVASSRTLIASARAGNVVGGGDFSRFRLIPDCIRALREKKPIRLRNPASTRPWQFVLDPIAGYLLLGARLGTEGKRFAEAWNFGPPVDNANTVERGAREVVANWGSGTIETDGERPFTEQHLLQLDCTKARQLLGHASILDFAGTLRMTTAWYRHQHESGDGDMRAYTLGQIAEVEAMLEARTGA